MNRLPTKEQQQQLPLQIYSIQPAKGEVIYAEATTKRRAAIQLCYYAPHDVAFRLGGTTYWTIVRLLKWERKA